MIFHTDHGRASKKMWTLSDRYCIVLLQSSFNNKKAEKAVLNLTTAELHKEMVSIYC